MAVSSTDERKREMQRKGSAHKSLTQLRLRKKVRFWPTEHGFPDFVAPVKKGFTPLS